MGSSASTPRVDRAPRWRVPAFGLLGAVLGFALFLVLENSGSTVAKWIANVPGRVYMLPRYHLEWPSLRRALDVQDVLAMGIVNLVVWSLLGLAVGVLLAVRRPRALPQSEGTR